jgi:cytochrome c553
VYFGDLVVRWFGGFFFTTKARSHKETLRRTFIINAKILCRFVFKRESFLILKSLKLLSFLLLLFIAINCFAQSVTKSEGEQLFRDYCAACHKPGTELIGPDIKKIRDQRDKVWIISFVQNSQKMILAGDKEAVKLFLDYKKVVMPVNDLTENQITSILNFADTVQSFTFILPDTSAVTKTKLAPAKNKPRFPFITTCLFIIGLLIIIIILISRLWIKRNRYLSSFDQLVTKNISKSVYLLLLLVMIIDTGFYLKRLRYFADQEKIIQITQSIWFSHETHYTTYKIECLSCHKDAQSNQKAGLPDVKSCMKCHGYIKKGATYGKVEIVKLYKKYYAHEELKWAEGYRLSQYAHFDHSLHTTAAKLNCVDCHTNQTHIEVSKLEFKMAWCITCHQTKKQDFSNKYYQKIFDSSYISKHPAVAVTGGIDCSKCHY